MLAIVAAIALVAPAASRPPAPRALTPAEVDLAAAALLQRASSGEPELREVQLAAARHAQRSRPPPSMRRRARLAALLPKLTAEVQRDDRRYHVVGLTSTSEVDYVRHTPGTQVAVRLAWDLSGVAFADAELRLAGESEAAAKAVSDAVERATRLHFERHRLLLALADTPPPTARERAERELEIAELGGILDAITGGRWSSESRR